MRLLGAVLPNTLGETIIGNANGKAASVTMVNPGKEFVEVPISLGAKVWNGTIKSLALEFTGTPGTTVEIDWIRVRK